MPFWPNETCTRVATPVVVEQERLSAAGVQPVHPRTSQPAAGVAATIRFVPGCASRLTLAHETSQTSPPGVTLNTPCPNLSTVTAIGGPLLVSSLPRLGKWVVNGRLRPVWG